MRNRNVIFVLAWIGLFWLNACGGGHQLQQAFVADTSWAGLWKGKALTLGAQQPPNELILDITFNNSKAIARFTDASQRLQNYPIQDLVLEDDTILFKLSHETERGLRRIVIFRGIRLGPHLKVEFSGSEGGRAFRGKWQARHYSRAVPEHTTESPADSTSSSG